MSIAQRVEVTGIRPLRQERKGGKEEGGEREIQAPRAGPNESFFFLDEYSLPAPREN